MRDAVIPGTVFLDEKNNELLQETSLKTLPGTTIILQPQPSDSPNDPYNWSTTKKNLYFFGILLSSVGSCVIGPLLGPGFGVLAEYFDEPLNKIIQINGTLTLTLGISSYICNQLCSVYGKRPLFFLTGIITLASVIWGANVKSYTSMIAARVVQGLGMGMTFSAAGTVSISDVFFVHERARMVGSWTFTVLIVGSITPIISGYVIQDLSWRWSFGLLAIYVGVALIFHFFLVPESGFVRKVSDNSFLSPIPTSQSYIAAQDLEEKISARLELTVDEQVSNQTVEKNEEKESYLQSLRIYTGRKTDLSTLYVLYRPLLLLQNPIVIWGILQWCLCFIWVILIGTTSAQMFTAAPYNLTVSQTGVLVGVAPLIGSTIGSLSSGIVSDFLVDYLAKRNNGIYEPEYRLLAMIPYVILVTVGGFGMACEYGKQSDICVGVLIAILFSGISYGCTGIITYTVDTMDAASGETFGVMMFFKSVFAFGLLFSITDWFASRGAKNQYCIMTGVTVAIALLSIPMYIYGKKVRHYMKDHSWYQYSE